MEQVRQGTENSEPLAEAYLDIETTGFSRKYDEITVVGICVCIGDNTNIFQFTGNDITADNILTSLQGVRKIYTYSGKSFDLPFIKSRLGADLTETFTHHDLMFDCHDHNLFGGCKEVERLLGIERQLKELDGLDAIKLWQKYIEQNDIEAFSALREYNKEDILMLKVLKEKLVGYSSIPSEKNLPEKRAKQKIRGDKSLSITISLDVREYSELVLTGMEFVITGRLEAFSREEGEARIRALGGTVKDNVTRKTTFLVVGEEPGSKLARAEALGIKQFTEEEFLKLLEEKSR